jgi:hypothetical protein
MTDLSHLDSIVDDAESITAVVLARWSVRSSLTTRSISAPISCSESTGRW